MPFIKVNVKDEIDQMKKEDKEFARAYDVVEKEYALIEQGIKLRKSIGITQAELSQITGMTQQMVSRIETVGNSPTLRNFIRYLDVIGLEIKIAEKETNKNQEYATTLK